MIWAFYCSSSARTRIVHFKASHPCFQYYSKYTVKFLHVLDKFALVLILLSCCSFGKGGAGPRSARSKLGTYYERGPNGEGSIFAFSFSADGGTGKPLAKIGSGAEAADLLEMVGKIISSGEPIFLCFRSLSLSFFFFLSTEVACTYYHDDYY